jgi:hypothetical protein
MDSRKAPHAHGTSAVVPSRGGDGGSSSNAGGQDGGPVGVRAVPTELRWKASLISPPYAAMVFGATSDASARPNQASGGLRGGNPNVVSTRDGRDKTPGAEGWTGRRPDPGSSALAVAWSRRSNDCTEAARGAADSTGNDGRATGAIARRAANQTARQLRNCPARSASLPPGTSVLSRAAKRVVAKVRSIEGWPPPQMPSRRMKQKRSSGPSPRSRSPGDRRSSRAVPGRSTLLRATKGYDGRIRPTRSSRAAQRASTSPPVEKSQSFPLLVFSIITHDL